MWKQSRKNPHLPHNSYQQNNAQVRSPHFDAESGQVYIEAQAWVPYRHQLDWIGEFRTPSLVKSIQPNPDGARRLLDMARSTIVKQVRGLTSDHLATVPWSVGLTIWEEIVASHRESFHAWRIFAQAYPSEMEFGASLYRYYLRIKQTPLPFNDYVRGITSTDVSWLTCLRISPKETRVADLVSLHQITNLAVLDLSDGQVSIDTKVSSFDERVLRTWADLAQAEGSFQHLQVLLLGWQEHVSMWLFKYLNSFPSLRQVILTDCPKMHQKNRSAWQPLASQYGWEARRGKRSAKSLRPILNEPSFHVGALSGLLYSELNSILGDDEATHSSTSQRPVLECWVGTPKSWTHILDDFPGTRTVFFDRVDSSTTTSNVVDSGVDIVKRARDQEPRPVEVRSPPSKRVWKPGVKSRAGALDLLGDFSAH